MSQPFSPQLVGETEKTLNAVLRHFLEPTGLTEPQWVTLRLAGQLGETADTTGLVAAVADRAHFTDAGQLVAQLNDRGLLAGAQVTEEGRVLVASVQARISAEVAPIWQGLPDTDLEATARVLNEVVLRARRVLEVGG